MKTNTTKTERLHDGFFKLDRVTFDQQKFDGSMMHNVQREVLVRPPVVFLSLYDAVADKMLFVEQCRVGALVRDHTNSLVLEPIAGIIDRSDKSPIDSAIRECSEEAGLVVDKGSLKIIHQGYTSSGGTSEYAYFVTGLFDSSNYVEQVGGVEGEQEDIRTKLICMEDALHMVETGKINSMSGAFGVYWHKVNSFQRSLGNRKHGVVVNRGLMDMFYRKHEALCSGCGQVRDYCYCDYGFKG